MKLRARFMVCLVVGRAICNGVQRLSQGTSWLPVGERSAVEGSDSVSEIVGSAVGERSAVEGSDSVSELVGSAVGERSAVEGSDSVSELVGSAVGERSAVDEGNDSVSELVGFAVGERFDSYDDLIFKVKAFKKAMSVQLTHRDSRTLEAAWKRVPKHVEVTKAELIYYSIHFACVFGGKKYKNKGTGQRTH